MNTNDIRHTTNKLSALGIKVPGDVDEAVKRAQLRVNVPTANATLAALDGATTQEELDEAVREFALARAIAAAGSDPGFLPTVRDRRERLASAAVHGFMLDALPQVCDRFNAATEPFTAALEAVPAGAASGSVLEMSDHVVTAVQRARETAAPLLSTLDAYNAVLRFLGLEVPTGKTGPSASLVVAMIGTDFPEGEDEKGNTAHWYAVNDVHTWARGGNVELAPLYPLVQIIRRGGRLELVDPADAERRLIVVPDAPRHAGFALL